MCPDCASELRQETRQGVTIGRCEGCGGIWFDADEITEYVRVSRPDAQVTPVDAHFTRHTRGAGLRCPCCEEDALELGAIAGVGFQRCTWCGGIFVKERDLKRLIDESSSVAESAVGARGLLKSLPDLADVPEPRRMAHRALRNRLLDLLERCMAIPFRGLAVGIVLAVGSIQSRPTVQEWFTVVFVGAAFWIVLEGCYRLLRKIPAIRRVVSWAERGVDSSDRIVRLALIWGSGFGLLYLTLWLLAVYG